MPAAAPEPDARSSARAANHTLGLGLAAAVLSVASAALFVRLARPLDPAVIAALRVAVTGTGMTVLARASTRETWLRFRRTPALAGRTVLAGALLALHFAAWIASLELTSVVRSVVLVSTQPLFAGLFGRLLGDRVHPGLLVGAGVAIGGSALMVIDGREALEAGLRVGDLLAVLAGAAAAAYLVVGRGVRALLPLGGYLAGVNLVATACLAAWVTLTATPWHPEGARVESYLCVIYLGVVPGIVGHGLLNWAVRRAPAHVVSLAVLLEPVGAGALAWIVLGETISLREGAGALLVLVGVGVGLWLASRAATARLPAEAPRPPNR